MKRYRLGAGRRAINFAARGLITLGLGGHYELLTVAGRTTGLPRSTRSGRSATQGSAGWSPPTGLSPG